MVDLCSTIMYDRFVCHDLVSRAKKFKNKYGLMKLSIYFLGQDHSGMKAKVAGW
jgi:hypothetical protein